MRKGFAKKTFALLLAVIMIMSSTVAGLSFLASALEWQYLDGTSYNPVTVYVQRDTMEFGKTYLIAVNDETKVLNGANTTVAQTSVSANVPAATQYVTSDDGSDIQFVADNDFIDDESNVYYTNNEFQWQRASNTTGYLYNAGTGLYLVNNSYKAVRMYGTKAAWTYDSANSKLSMYLSSKTRYLRWSDSQGKILIGSSDSANKLYFYEKVTVYDKLGSDEGSMYKYVGQTDFAVDIDTELNDQAILDTIAVLHKAPGEEIPDEECAKLTINDEAITFVWDDTVNMNKLGDYTGTVFVYGQAFQKLTVHVQDHSAVFNGVADPSTSRIENRFSLTSADNGKLASDKTVQYGSDEFGTFGSYAGDEFSVALSALGQGYEAIETEETVVREKVHPDIVFIIDASGSMRVYNVAGGEEITRGEATAIALNNAIKELYAEDPETRIGIVTYGFGVDRGVYLPLDKYTLPEGQTDYITWGGRYIASSGTSNTNNDLAFDIKKQTKTGTVSSIKTTSNYKWPGVVSNNDGSWSYNECKPADLTLIATTAEGISYYGLSDNSSMIFLFSSDKEMPIAYMTKTPGSSSSNGNYTNYYVDDYIKITCTGTSSVSYTLYDYQKQTGNVKLAFENDPYIMATNYLINSKGEVVKPSTHHFTMGIGTFTQAGLQEAENLFAAADNKENRVPAIVLLSDGVPTVSDTDVNNPHLNQDNGVTVGYGVSTSPVTSQDLCDAGLRTIETAMKVKANVNEMYQNSGNREGLFYSIGPGVDYIFGQTILNPTNENIAAAAAKTTNVGEDTESGVGIPSDLAKKITAKYTDLDYVNYADWSYTGDVTSEELDLAFRKIVTSIVDIQRPVVELTSTEYGMDDVTGAMIFTDNIGEGMAVSSDLVVRYGNNNYEPTNKEETTLEDGTQVTRFSYDYRVVEQSTRKAYNLKGLTVLLLTNPDGTQTVKWYIPGDLIPVIMYDGFEEEYVPVSPIRLVYKVALEDEGLKGTFYTNDTDDDDIANAEFVPAVGNPYYYDNVLGDDDKIHSVLKEFTQDIARKTKNTTSTSPYARDSYMVDNGDNTANIITNLGNNGLIQVDLTNLYFTKMWNDENDKTHQRPDEITVQLYRDGYVYGEPMTIKAEDCSEVVDGDGNDGWYYVIKGLPFSKDFVYTVEEYDAQDYESYIEKVGDEVTVTNTLDHSQLTYELYLVDKNGNPVDENGNIVDFEDRVPMSDTVTINNYIHNTETIDLDELEELLPPGYFIYNPETSFTETYEGKDNENTKATVVDDETGTTKIAVPEEAEIDKNGNVTGLGDFSEILVDFAICKIAINPDVIVVDYGKTILCSPLDNDCGNSVKIIGLGDIDGTTYSKEYTSQNGVFRIEDNNVIFTPFSYMSSINRVKYYVTTVSDDPAYQQLSSTIAVIPATSMYYEDDFGGSDENGGLYINYTGEWYTVDDEGNVTLGQEANTDLSDRQDRGEIAQGNTPYGYDSSYDDCVNFSNGSASRVEGSVSLNPATHKPEFNATAEFTFTGTGFDIISRTDLDCGMITVYVTDENGNSVNVPVINKGVQNLYQIPVISFDCKNYFDHAYGTFKVKINVNAPAAALNINSSVFYLDAIRIYDPMGNDENDNAEYKEAHDAYNRDHEANEYVASIRDYILQVGKLDETEQFGAVYVDTINNDYTDGGMLDDKEYTGEKSDEEKRTSGADTLAYRELDQSMIKDFELIGPNEEVYLSPGYGVGFIVETTKKPASVQLEMKIPAPIRTGASLSVYTYGKTKDIGKIEINSATEMFYDITKDVIFTEENGKYRAVVVLENGLPSTDAGEIVSITNLKLTYDDDVIALDAADEEAIFTLDSYDESEVAVTSLKASWDLYEDVFNSVYTHKMASTPNYEIAEIETTDTTESGKTVTATVKTSKYVDDLVIKDAYGNVIKPVSISSELDESKILTAEYKEAKTWTVSFKVYGLNGNTAGYTIESANGEGEVSTVEFAIHNPKVTAISVYKQPKTSYRIGESFDSEDMALKVTYDDGSQKIVTSGFSTEDVKFTKAGNYNVKVSYGGVQTTVKTKTSRSILQIILTFFGLGWLFK